MSLLCLDFESFYSDQLGFSVQTTEEYINDRDFEVIGVSVKVDDQPAEWFSGTHDEIKNWLQRFDWENSALLAHNAIFDASILAWRFGLHARFIYDTLGMARAVRGVEAGGSLKALAEAYGIGHKGEEVVAAKGKRRLDFSEADLFRYGEYCKNDVELTYKLFEHLLDGVVGGADHNTLESFKVMAKAGLSTKFPEDELDLINMTLQMYLKPTLRVNDALLIDRLKEIREEKSELLSGLMELLNVETEEAVRKKLASNKQFADILLELGVTPPTKISKTTGALAFAFAKTDEGFLKLQEHPLPAVQQLCAVRVGTKSTIEESRIERFIDIGSRNKGYLPIPLKYYGAHTGRWSGMDAVNFQNLPSRDKKKKALKNSVIPPPGYVVINADSSQIEARVLAWLAGQHDLLKQFADGEDVYSLFASRVYLRPISDTDTLERFLGKTCILGLGYGTGATKLQQTLAAGGIYLKLSQCQEIVDLYRSLNNRIPALWREAEIALLPLMSWPTDKPAFALGQAGDALLVTPEGIRLPNGMYIRYPNLRRDGKDVVYDSRRGKIKLWGGAAVENVVQALARIVISTQMLEIQKLYKIALTVHDSVVCVVPENVVEEAVKYITEVMSQPPSWALGLPVACKVKYGQSYGEAS